MRKGVVVLVLFVSFLFVIPFISAESVGEELQRVTYYAEQYETGNIDYVKLVVYLGSVRENLNEIMGAVGREMGGIIEQEDIESALGEPNERTRWIWVEGEHHDVRWHEQVPVWRKIVFDGNKIQIILNAHPTGFERDGEILLYYNLHFETEFKRPEMEVDIDAKIEEIKGFAETFNTDPSDENAETLARESVNAEKLLEQYLKRQAGQCIDVMKGIFGAENQREMQKMLIQEIYFYSGENFDAIVRLELCDECEWKWINVDLWIEGRGPGFDMGGMDEDMGREDYKDQEIDFKSEIALTFEEIKNLLDQGDYKEAMKLRSKLWALNEAWNRQSNEIWEILNEERRAGEESIKERERQMQENENWEDTHNLWMEFENSMKQRERDIRENNYHERKEFYLRLFEGYEREEFYFEEINFEKRLIQEFRVFGEEICDNSIDDNENGQLDCAEAQCAGQVCGITEVVVGDENNSRKEKRELFCISNMCQLPEEVEEDGTAICGNNICEAGEETVCVSDCPVCPEHPAIECFGRVIFGGEDQRGCPLEPVCIEENVFCDVDTDCPQPLCGDSACIRFEPEDEVGRCRIEELTQCEEAECTDGQEKVKQCSTGEEIIANICINNMWEDTGVECQGDEIGIPEETPVIEVSGNECVVKNDCGRTNDVCSNGWCVALPDVIPVEEPQVLPEEPEEPQEPETPEPSGEGEEEPLEETGEGDGTVTVDYILSLLTPRQGFALVSAENGDDGATDPPADEPPEEPPSEEPPADEPPSEDVPPEEGPPVCEGDCDDGDECTDDWCDEGSCQSAFRGDLCPDDSRADFHDDGTMPPTAGEVSCEDNCENQCREGVEEGETKRVCFDNCVDEKCRFDDGRSEDWEGPEEFREGDEIWDEGEWVEQPKEEIRMEEKGVFTVGGNCRKSQQESNSFIWFGGWGDPFERIQPLKNKYYMGGQADWCKWELDNAARTRKEMENGFNQEFVEWFFDSYLANNAEDWEQSISGIFELYWKNVDTQFKTAHVMSCLDLDEIPYDYTLINFSYETTYGMVEYWEELRTVNMPEFGDEPVILISPYMKFWIFPSKEFIKYEFQKSMEDHEFPGPSEDKAERERQEGLTDEEKAEIKQDERFMETLGRIVDGYEGRNIDAVVQLKDLETDELVFNMYVQVNEEDIMKMEPMLYSEVPAEDVRIEIDFEKVYDMIETSEREMRDVHIESPPWDRRIQPVQRVKEVINGVKMYFKVRAIMNSAKIYPESAESDAKDLFNLFFKIMGKGDDRRGGPGEEDEMGDDKAPEGWDSQEVITGEVVFSK